LYRNFAIKLRVRNKKCYIALVLDDKRKMEVSVEMVVTQLQLSSYVAFAIFLVVLLAKAKKWASMPLHLRWELYPVPHEPEHHYGGSYMEYVEWWKRPRKTTLAGELKELLMEMLFIKRVFEYKRPLWLTTYPFHAGIYLILAWFALLFVGGLTEAYARIDIPSEHPWAMLIYYLILITGGLGIILGTLGCLGVLLYRLSDYDLRKYTAGVEYLNLVFILVVYVLGAIAWLTFDRDFSIARAYMTSLVSFGSIAAPELSNVTLAHVVLLELLFIYIPFTKMSHFVGKYFTFHKVLWDDEPNFRGSEIEKRVREVLGYRISWDSPHITPGRTWAEEALKPTKLDTPKRWEP